MFNLATPVCLAFAALAAARHAPPDTLVISDVSVLPMSSDVLLEHRTVVIANGRIVSIKPYGQATTPAGAQVVDGRGKFLLPGLADMHVHLTTVDALPMFVGYGVLTVRDLNGSPETLGWRDETARGVRVGPRIFASGPMIAGNGIPWKNKVVPTTAAEADDAVVAQKKAGYDQIKIYDGLSVEVFNAVMRAAKRERMLSSGHIPDAVGFDGVLASGITGLEHLDKTVFAVFKHDLDTLAIPALARRMKMAGVWVTPTLESMIQLSRVGSGGYDSLMSAKEALAAPADLREFWQTVTGRVKGNRTLQAGTKYGPWTDFQMNLAGALARAGVPLLAGTDLPNAVLVPGHSLLGELEALVEAGLTHYQAIEAATSAPARFFGQQTDWGTVAVAQRANLLLLNANPMIGLHALRQPAGAVVNGRWLGEGELAALRDGRPAGEIKR